MCERQRAWIIVQIAAPYFQQAHEQGLTKLVDYNRNIWQLDLGCYQLIYVQSLLNQKSLIVKAEARGRLLEIRLLGNKNTIYIEQAITQVDVQWFLHLKKTKPQYLQQTRIRRRKRGRQRQLQI